MLIVADVIDNVGAVPCVIVWVAPPGASVNTIEYIEPAVNPENK